MTNSSPASSQISRSSSITSRADPGRDRLQLLRVELDAGLLGLAQDVHERQLDVVHQVGQAALFDLRALRVRERVDQDREGRELVAGVGGDPALLRELVERVAAAGGVEQVAGDRGVEDEVCGTSPSALASWAMIARSPRAAMTVVGSSVSPASAMLPPA